MWRDTAANSCVYFNCKGLPLNTTGTHRPNLEDTEQIWGLVLLLTNPRRILCSAFKSNHVRTTSIRKIARKDLPQRSRRKFFKFSRSWTNTLINQFHLQLHFNRSTANSLILSTPGSIHGIYRPCCKIWASFQQCSCTTLDLLHCFSRFPSFAYWNFFRLRSRLSMNCLTRWRRLNCVVKTSRTRFSLDQCSSQCVPRSYWSFRKGRK